MYSASVLLVDIWVFCFLDNSTGDFSLSAHSYRSSPELLKSARAPTTANCLPAMAIPDKALQGGRVCFGSWFEGEGTVHHGGKAWWQSPEAAHHLELQSGRREKQMLSSLSLFCFWFFLGTHPVRGCCHIQGGFSLS